MIQRGQAHVMSDERILGDSAFVENLLSKADEQYDHRYQLKRLGYDADRIVERVAEIYDMDPQDIMFRGRQRKKVKARSLFCFWAVKELGLSLRELARRLGMPQPEEVYAVRRGERLATEKGLKLTG